MALRVYQVLPPMEPVGRLPCLCSPVRPGFIHQLQPVQQIEVDIGEVIGKTARHVDLLGCGVKFQPVDIPLSQRLAQAAVKFKALIQVDTVQGGIAGVIAVQRGYRRMQARHDLVEHFQPVAGGTAGPVNQLTIGIGNRSHFG